MKRSLILLSATALLFCGALTAFAQIPNAGFETWIPVLNSPTGWATGNIPGFYTTVTQSTTAHSGSSSAKGTVVAFATNPIPPTLTTIPGFPWSQRSAVLTGYYQFFPAAGTTDSAYVTVVLYKGQLTAPVAAGGASLGSSSSWKQFSAPLIYVSTTAADTGMIMITIGGSSGTSSPPHAGSYFLVDDLAFSGTAPLSAVENTGNSVPNSFALEQNYPNPFNPSTKISFSLAQQGFATLKVYSILGVEVASLVNEQKDPGTFSVNWNAAGLPSGMYLYRLSVTSEKGQVFEQSKKLMLLK
ncbi:MAG: T9SS type A sorting domain-containing protein [Ignavibacteriales bacterium]|nr:T9SS type A sorting domain-containing protein [Ignavibacteriales bacterium]